MKLFKRLKRKFFIILIIIQLLLVYWYFRRQFPEPLKTFQFVGIYYTRLENEVYEAYKSYNLNEWSHFKVNTGKKRELKSGLYVILEYTKVFKQPKYCHLNLKKSDGADNQNYFHYLDKCKYKNCRFTCDKAAWEARADAVMFHESDLPDEYKNAKEFLKYRRDSQIWFVYNDEPHSVPDTYDELQFNWTMSYYTDSDVSFCAYGCYQKLSSAEIDKLSHETAMIREFQSRGSHALWFNSNCNSKKRIEFASFLANHYPTLIYGSCFGYAKAFVLEERAKDTLKGDECKRDSDCESDNLNKAKFFLAFESTNCSDYITEKFWRSLYYGMIPVVFQPSKQYYQHVAPAHSFIHAQDFEYDAKKLAHYLTQVSTDINLYMKHVEWRKKYKVLYRAEDVEPYRICELCAKLNEEQKSMYYSSVSTWFNKKCTRE